MSSGNRNAELNADSYYSIAVTPLSLVSKGETHVKYGRWRRQVRIMRSRLLRVWKSIYTLGLVLSYRDQNGTVY